MLSTSNENPHLKHEIEALGPWFHNIEISGIETAPNHPLGDYPRTVWREMRPHLKDVVHGRTILDIGCNGGFFAIEMTRLGASRVVAIDHDPRYLAQARFAAKHLEADIEFHDLSVYDIAKLGQSFDVVLFMGVMYHLRHPLLALDLVSSHAAHDVLVFQSMLRGSESVDDIAQDFALESRTQFLQGGFPKLHFIERKYAADPTNWWIPNRAAAEAMLRSAGFDQLKTITNEVYLARRVREPAGEGAAYATRS